MFQQESLRLLCAALCCCVAAGCGNSPEPGANSAAINPPPAAETPSTGHADTPMILPGVTPLLIPADKATLPDDARVIGVSAGGVDHAFSVETMSRMYSHVVNDLLGTQPISVTYCDRTDCARVLTREPGTEPIPLDLGGWMQGSMALRYRQKFYPQLDESLPLQNHDFELTTWKAWRDAHPETLLYIGNEDAKQLLSKGSADTPQHSE